MNSAQWGIHFEKLGWVATDALTKGLDLSTFFVFKSFTRFNFIIVVKVVRTIVVELNVQLFTKLCLDKKV